jgi:hypothetical protein
MGIGCGHPLAKVCGNCRKVGEHGGGGAEEGRGREQIVHAKSGLGDRMGDRGDH